MRKPVLRRFIAGTAEQRRSRSEEAGRNRGAVGTQHRKEEGADGSQDHIASGDARGSCINPALTVPHCIRSDSGWNGAMKSASPLGIRAAFFGVGIICLLEFLPKLPALAQQSATYAPNPAAVPTDRLNEAWWAARHKAVVKAVQSHADSQLLLIGDSIFNNYEKAKPPNENFLATW